MKNIKNCEEVYLYLGDCWHIWSGENFESFLLADEDFKLCMSVVGITAKLCSRVSILTFELMSNHLHLCVAGEESEVENFSVSLQSSMIRVFNSIGKTIRWKDFSFQHRKLNSLEETRNVISYINRNGFLVNRNHNPFTYPWGLNSYFFNYYKCEVARDEMKDISLRERRILYHSKQADFAEGLKKDKSGVSALSFCALDMAEMLFRDSAHYFYKISRSIESDKHIARECGEEIFYTDEELYSTVCNICQKKFEVKGPQLLSFEQKLELMKIMRWEYNSSPKQIARLLKVEVQHVSRLLGTN